MVQATRFEWCQPQRPLCRESCLVRPLSGLNELLIGVAHGNCYRGALLGVAGADQSPLVEGGASTC